VNPIRPQIVPPGAAGSQVQRPADPARAAAQRAFFEAALGRAPVAVATQVAAQAEAPASAPVTAQRRPDPAAPQPEKILRPGSLLDIRI
jgi:hypothetical protein